MVFWLSGAESARVRHIAYVLFRNNLGFILARLGFRRALPFATRIKTKHFKEQELSPKLVLRIFEELEGTFVKLGQLLSLRPDLLPAEYCEELSKLQDNVRPFSGEHARQIIEKELGKPIGRIFSEFDEKPIAAASMGQVHLAKLKDGTKIAVKVQRPDIEKTVKTDVRLLYRIAELVKKRYGTGMINPVEIVREFERYTENELNYLKEAHNIDLFYRNFSRSQMIIVPRIFWNYTTGKVLTMEYIAGKRMTDIEKYTPAQRKKLLENILNAEFEQIFIHGLFHADPHPGNFIIKKDGKIALLDLGIVGRLDYLMKEHITNFFVSMIGADPEGMANEAVKLGVAPEGADIDSIKRDIYDEMSAYYGTPLDKIPLSHAFNRIIKIMREHHMKVAPDFVLLFKAIVTLEGMASKLYPKMNFVEMARPFVKRIARERLNPRRVAEHVRRKVENLLQFTESIPRKTNALITELDSTDKDLRRIDRDLGMLAAEIDRSSNRVTLGFLAGTLFIASTILLPFLKTDVFGIPALSLAGYIIGLVILVAIAISMLQEKKI